MQDNANANDRPALPLKGYSLMDFQPDPTVVGIAFETEDGPFMFVATREILEMLGQAFIHKAASMPSRQQS